MQFNFKHDDMVTCEVTRTTVIAKENVKAGTVVQVTGWIAKQLMSGALPALKLIGDGDPQPFTERDTEIILSTPEPAKKTPPKKKAAAKKPEPDDVVDEGSGD